MDQKFDIDLKCNFNGRDIFFMSRPFYYSELKNNILELISDRPLFCAIHGMPGVGKSFLASLLSENLLHCPIVDFDSFCRHGNSIDLRHYVSIINQSMFFVIKTYEQFLCNIIYTTSAPQDKVFDSVTFNKLYDILVIEFGMVDETYSIKHCINGLSMDQVRFMKTNYKPLIPK